MHKFNMSFVFPFYILGLMSWIWTSPSLERLKFENPSKWNSYEGFNLDHWPPPLQSKLCSITCDVMEFCSVNMDAWYYRIRVACDTVEFEFVLLLLMLAWCTPLGRPGQCGICMHQHSTSGIRRKRRIRIRRWHSLYWHVARARVWVDFFGGLR